MTFDLLFGGAEQNKQAPKLEPVDMIEDYLLLSRSEYREKYQDVEFEHRNLTTDELTAVLNLQAVMDSRKKFLDADFLEGYSGFLGLDLRGSPPAGAKGLKIMLLNEKKTRKE